MLFCRSCRRGTSTLFTLKQLSRDSQTTCKQSGKYPYLLLADKAVVVKKIPCL